MKSSEVTGLRQPALVLTLGAVLAFAVMLIGIALTGASTPTVIADPGALVRWGLPIVDVVVQLGCAVTIGALALAAFVLPRTGKNAENAWKAAVRTAAVASVIWTIAVGIQLVLTYAQVSGRPLGGEKFGEELGIFLTQIEIGQAGLWALILTALTSLLTVAVSGYTSAILATILALVSLAPVAQTGHAAGAADHTVAVGSLWLHLAGVTLWIGGLAVLAVLAPLLKDGTAKAASRYSSLAIWAFALVATSGIVNASVRLGGLEGLATPYGALVIGKVIAVVALGVAGWWHRRSTIPRLTGGRDGTFWRLVAVEVLIAGATMGLAVALSNTAPPVPDVPLTSPSPAEQVTGRVGIHEPTSLGWLTGWYPDVLVLTGVVSAAVVIGIWYARLRRRGDAWPALRILSLAVGLALIAWTSSGGPAVYGHILFSAHMVQHMVLVMLAPIFLVAGAPVTLALRALPSRDDGSRGPRELLLGLVHSRWAGFFANPVVAAVNVAGSMYIFYYTPLFELSLSNHLVHLWRIVHFTLAGYMFVNVLIGIDPGPKRPGYPLRLLLLFATMAFHAFFGLGLTTGTQLLAANWFGMLGLPWGVDALKDQQFGGAFAWGFGEIPSLALAVMLGFAWIRDDAKTAKRLDRKADRDGDAELVAYNAMLARMAGGGRTSDEGGDGARAGSIGENGADSPPVSKDAS